MSCTTDISRWKHFADSKEIIRVIDGFQWCLNSQRSDNLLWLVTGGENNYYIDHSIDHPRPGRLYHLTCLYFSFSSRVLFFSPVSHIVAFGNVSAVNDPGDIFLTDLQKRETTTFDYVCPAAADKCFQLTPSMPKLLLFQGFGAILI